MLQVVYAQEAAPRAYSKSVFLVGPTPRAPGVRSWRPLMIETLRTLGYDGVVFSPEPRGGEWKGDYDTQVEWEKCHLEMADLVLAWVPRQLPDMPAFTTNVEFGRYVHTHKLRYGRPPDSAKNRYLDWMYHDLCGRTPHDDMASMVREVVDYFGEGAARSDAEREVPFHVWKSPMFQEWYAALTRAGNRLDGVKVLWTFWPLPAFMFSCVLHVKVWVAAEGRHKENEFVFSRPDISCVVAYHVPPGCTPFDAKVVMVKEFRSPVRNAEGCVLELPGGSSFKPGRDPLEVAAAELYEETGLCVDAGRFFRWQSRQVASTLSTHHATLFAVHLSDAELAFVEAQAASGETHGVAEDSERTKVVVRTVRDLVLTEAADWSMIGMVLKVVANPHLARYRDDLSEPTAS